MLMDITGWSAISPYGLGIEPFAAAIRAGRPAMPWHDPAGPPGATAHLVPGFDQRTVLGRKGTKGMDRVTGLAVAAVAPLTRARPEAGTALVLGTSGSVRSMMDFTRASLTGERPFDVNPAVIPSVVMNCAAAQCAIWHGLIGPNATIAGGRTAGLHALSYARRLLRAGRAGAVLCGAAEEYSTERSWLAHHGGTHNSSLGEGAAVLRLEPPGAPGALGTVLAVAERVTGGGTAVRCAMDKAGVAAGQVWAVISHDDVAELAGDSGAAAGMFGVAAALALAAGEAGPRIAVVCCADPAGAEAAAVLRLNGGG